MLTGTKPLPEPVLTKISDTIWPQEVNLSHVIFFKTSVFKFDIVLPNRKAKAADDMELQGPSTTSLSRIIQGLHTNG